MGMLRSLFMAAAVSLPSVVGAATIAEYDFNGNALDTSGNGNHLTLFGDASFGTGNDGQALDLDGVGDYAYSDFANFGLTTFTVELWMYSRNIGSSVAYVDMREGQFVRLSDTSSFTSLNTWASGLSPSNAGTLVSTSLSNNQWYHLAYTFDGSAQRLMIDGVEVANVATTGSLRTGPDLVDGLTIGALAGGSNTFNGLIDSVRIHDVAMTAQDLGFSLDTTPSPVPLPASGLLLAAALAGAGALRHRASKKAAA